MSDVESCTCETKTVGSYPTEVVAVQTLCCNRDMNPSSNSIGDTYAGETDSLRLNRAFMCSPGNARLFANRHCYRCGVMSAEDAAEEELRGNDVSVNCTLVVERHKPLLNQLFKFKPASKLHEYVIKRGNTNKKYFTLAEVLSILRDAIRGEGLYDENNPSIIICSSRICLFLLTR